MRWKLERADWVAFSKLIREKFVVFSSDNRVNIDEMNQELVVVETAK